MPDPKTSSSFGWTYNHESGRTHDSLAFHRCVKLAGDVIRSSAARLLAGGLDGVAHDIIAQLAHFHHLAPRAPGAFIWIRCGGCGDEQTCARGHADVFLKEHADCVQADEPQVPPNPLRRL